MTLQIDTQYPNAIAASAAYPNGSFKNATTPASLDGTPVDKEWGNDILGFMQKILQDANITANQLADTAVLSQVLNGIKHIAGLNSYQADIDYAVDSVSMGSDGILYQCLIANGPASSVVDPVGDLTSTWEPLLSPNQDISNPGYKVHPVGADGKQMIEQWGDDTATSGGTAVLFPVAFPNAVLSFSGMDQTIANGYFGAANPTLIGFDFYTNIASNSGYWHVIGY